MPSSSRALFPRSALLFSLLTLGCATAQTERDAAPKGGEVEIDPALPTEAAALTSRLVRASSAGAWLGAAAVVDVLEGRLTGEPGLEVESYTVGKGKNKNLKVRLKGSDSSLPPVLLIGHAGTAPVDKTRWPKDTPPFDAVTAGEHLFGRGALDMYAPLALWSLALAALARAEVTPARDVVLLVTGDLEDQTSALLHALGEWPELLDAEVALTEGGLWLQDGVAAGQDLVTLAWADKGRLDVALTVEDELAPAHRPRDGAAPARLARALARLDAWRSPARPPDVARRTAAALARARGGTGALLAGNDGLTERFLVPELAKDPWTRPLLEHGCAITRMGAEDMPLTVPAKAGAIVVCGVLPGATVDEVRDELLLAIDDPRVRVRVRTAVPASVSPPDGPALAILRGVLHEERAGLPVVPWVSPRPTPAGELRARGVAVYGFVPLRVDRAELESAGAARERVRPREIEDALPRVTRAILALAQATEPLSYGAQAR